MVKGVLFHQVGEDGFAYCHHVMVIRSTHGGPIEQRHCAFEVTGPPDWVIEQAYGHNNETGHWDMSLHRHTAYKGQALGDGGGGG